MPELPEVLTTIKYLKPKMVSKTIVDIWKNKKTKIGNQINKSFSKALVNKKILAIENIGKYILFYLSSDLVLIIHQKISGYLLIDKFTYQQGIWYKPNQETLRFPLIGITLSNLSTLVLIDHRRLSRLSLVYKKDLLKITLLKQMGLNPLLPSFTWQSLYDQFTRHPRLNLKKALLNQTIVSGLGNIYSDEVLFLSKLKPFKLVSTLTQAEIKLLHKNIIKVLTSAIKNKGTTFANYHNPSGQKGGHLKYLRVYQRKDKPCLRCGAKIKCLKINQRSSYFCNKCQK